jgi:hypothetical protein
MITTILNGTGISKIESKNRFMALVPWWLLGAQRSCDSLRRAFLEMPQHYLVRIHPGHREFPVTHSPPRAVSCQHFGQNREINHRSRRAATQRSAAAPG